MIFPLLAVPPVGDGADCGERDGGGAFDGMKGGCDGVDRFGRDSLVGAVGGMMETVAALPPSCAPSRTAIDVADGAG